MDGWSYDAAGDLLNDGRNTYTYDAEGRIVSLNGNPMYLYDAEGKRVAKYSGSTITTFYLLDLGGNQLTEIGATGAWNHTNVFAGGRLLATFEGPGESTQGYHFHLTDWLGTKRMQTTANGNEEERCYSYPFGDGLTCTGAAADATEHHFTGKERDAESGNDYFNARYYSSSMGRFMSPDWSSSPEAVPYADLDNPQTLNLYSYAGNNPLIHVDADGHCWPQWLCNSFKQVFLNVVTAGMYAYFQHQAKVTAEHRQYLINNGYTLVNGSGKPVDLNSASAGQINTAYDQARADQFRQALGLASQIPTVAGSTVGESGAQDKKLTSQEVENLQKNTGESAHEIKEGALGTNKNISKYDLYKNGQGEIVAKPKGSSGVGEPTGYTTEHLRTPQE